MKELKELTLLVSNEEAKADTAGGPFRVKYTLLLYLPLLFGGRVSIRSVSKRG